MLVTAPRAGAGSMGPTMPAIPHMASAAHQFVIEREPLSTDSRPGEVLSTVLGVSRQGPRKLGIPERTQCLTGQSGDISTRNDQGAAAVLDDIGNTTCVGGDNDDASCTTLGNRRRHVVDVIADQMDVVGIVQVGHLVKGYETAERDRIQLQVRHQLLEIPALRTIRGDRQRSFGNLVLDQSESPYDVADVVKRLEQTTTHEPGLENRAFTVVEALYVDDVEDRSSLQSEFRENINQVP